MLVFAPRRRPDPAAAERISGRTFRRFVAAE
jgi:hypothetical protein